MQQPNGVKTDIRPSAIMHWGSKNNHENAPEPLSPYPSQGLLELEAKMICSSSKQRLVLTTKGTVYTVIIGSTDLMSSQVHVTMRD